MGHLCGEHASSTPFLLTGARLREPCVQLKARHREDCETLVVFAFALSRGRHCGVTAATRITVGLPSACSKYTQRPWYGVRRAYLINHDNGGLTSATASVAFLWALHQLLVHR